jgi:uncharacterized protein YprB with RNaseH-like and TPR domain
MMEIVIWDLETTNLTALMGKVLCSSFVTLDGEPYTFRADDAKFKGRSLIDDSKLVVAVRDELEKYDMVVAHNGRLFDIPFLNARLSKAGARPFHPHFVLDTRWYLNSASMKIGSAKLDNAAKFYNLGEQKTPLDWETWQMAATRDREAMDKVVEHCEGDVKVLRQLYPYVLPYVATLHR